MNFNILKKWLLNHIEVKSRLETLLVWYLFFLMVSARKHSLQEAANFSGINKSQFSRFLKNHSGLAVYNLDQLSKKQANDFDKAVYRVAELFQIKPAEILLPSKQPHRVKARSLLCFWAVKELGISSLSVALKLGITQPSVSRAVQRGEKLAIENNLYLENELKGQIA